MKLLKYILVLAIAFCAVTSMSNAQAYIGGGSSALFLELGQAAAIEVGTAHAGAYCIYSHKSSNLNAGSTVTTQDNRLGPAATTDGGDFWLVWGPTGGNCANPDLVNPFYMYTSLDSVVGNRGYFEVDPGNGAGCVAGAGFCQQLVLAAADLVCPGAGCPDSILNVNPPAAPYNNLANNAAPPAALIAAIHNKHWNWAGTDIRPEDAKFATFRALSTCDAWIARQPFDLIVRYTQGLGYTAGTIFTDDFGAGKTLKLKNFNISGNDPVTGNPVPGFDVLEVGAQPIIVAVAPDLSVAPTGIAKATDIPGFVAANFFNGTLGRASDLLGGADNWAVTTLVREPLSGTYNTFEYGAVNNSQFHVSQDGGNCTPGNPPGNPLHIVSANGVPLQGGTAQSFRRRVIGTGQMTTQLQAATATDQRIGYFFWGAANVANLTKVRYLKYNGVDPIRPAYVDGVLPASNATGDPCLGNIVTCPAGTITFAGLNSGAYPLWSALRIITPSPAPAALNALVTAAQTLNSSQTDFVPLASLNVWRSHFYMNSINVNTAAMGTTLNPATPNDLCPGGLAEQGGDVGGAIILKKANADFCSDYGNNTGLVNKTE